MAALFVSSKAHVKNVALQTSRLLPLVLITLLGCSRTPARLARQIAEADRVLAKYDAGSSAVTNSYSGEEAHELVKLVSRAKLDNHKGDVMGPAGCSLLFYKGTNFLAEIPIIGNCLWTDEGRFVEKSGVVEETYDAVNSKFQPMSVRANHGLQRMPRLHLCVISDTIGAAPLRPNR